MAPAYQLVPVSDLPGRHRLRSSSTLELFVPSYRLTTIGSRSFPVAAATLWNTLLVHIQSSPSIATFLQRLKTFLFHHSFPDIIVHLTLLGLTMLSWTSNSKWLLLLYSHAKNLWLIEYTSDWSKSEIFHVIVAWSCIYRWRAASASNHLSRISESDSTGRLDGSVAVSCQRWAGTSHLLAQRFHRTARTSSWSETSSARLGCITDLTLVYFCPPLID